MVQQSYAIAVSRPELTGPAVDASGLGPTIAADRARQLLAQHHACYLTSFPRVVEDFVTLLSCLGRPLENYGTDRNMVAYSLHPCLNRVRYVPQGDRDAWVHEQAGALPAHTARSWRAPRPRYFAMLKVDVGWRDVPPGEAGESLLVRWRDVLTVLARDDHHFCTDIEILMNTPVQFAADHVVEANSDLPVVYRLPDAESEFDVGARIKGDFTVMERSLDLSHLPAGHRGAYLDALRRFIAAANRPPARALFTMEAGDLLVIDNDRFGHGRLPFRSERRGGDRKELNQRELWSATLD